MNERRTVSIRRAVVVFSAVASALYAASAATAEYSDDAHAGGVKAIHFHAEKSEELKDLMVERGIDFVMTNHLTPMIEAFKALGLSADATERVPPRAVEADPISYIAHQGEEALASIHSKAAFDILVQQFPADN